jgi:hypothetical protein
MEAHIGIRAVFTDINMPGSMDGLMNRSGLIGGCFV